MPSLEAQKRGDVANLRLAAFETEAYLSDVSSGRRNPKDKQNRNIRRECRFRWYVNTDPKTWNG